MAQVYGDKGHGHDQKYSLWRREQFPKIAQRRDCYCSDLDWVEWRNGKPVALLECRRAIGTLKTAEAVIAHFTVLNNGFQLEMYARLSYELKIPAFLIAIEDRNLEKDDYADARFIVEKITPPDNWPEGRLNLKQIILTEMGIYNQEEYAQFLASL